MLKYACDFYLNNRFCFLFESVCWKKVIWSEARNAYFHFLFRKCVLKRVRLYNFHCTTLGRSLQGSVSWNTMLSSSCTNCWCRSMLGSVRWNLLRGTRYSKSIVAPYVGACVEMVILLLLNLWWVEIYL